MGFDCDIKHIFCPCSCTTGMCKPIFFKKKNLAASKQKGTKHDKVSFFTSKTKTLPPPPLIHFLPVTPKSAHINSCELNSSAYMTCVTFLSAPLCLPRSASDPIVFDFPLSGFTAFWKSLGKCENKAASKNSAQIQYYYLRQRKSSPEVALRKEKKV